MSHQNKVYASRKGSKSSTCSQHKPKVAKRRPLNRFEADSGVEGLSASGKKLRLSNSSDDIDVDAGFGYRHVNFISVMHAIAQVVVCKTCGQDIKFTESAMCGLGFKIVISCENCKKTEIPNSPSVTNGYEINHRMTFAIRTLGIGLNGIKKMLCLHGITAANLPFFL